VRAFSLVSLDLLQLVMRRLCALLGHMMSMSVGWVGVRVARFYQHPCMLDCLRILFTFTSCTTSLQMSASRLLALDSCFVRFSICHQRCQHE
jgi:hypothetical protein